MDPAENILADLNDKQKEAVVSNSRRLLVLAGAGSGKTKTLLQKLVYLVFHNNIKPSCILAITFTKNAANEMIDRLIFMADHTGRYQEIVNDKSISIKNKEEYRREYTSKYTWISKITIRTFHSLCYYVLKNYGAREFDNQFKLIIEGNQGDDKWHKLIAPEEPFDIIHKILLECCQDNLYMLKLKRYILDYFVDRIYLIDPRELNKYVKPYTTLRGERVRSKSERDIADWLYRHNIAYQYEPNVNFKNFNFRPDFYIPPADLFIEHVSEISHPIKNKEEEFFVANKRLVKTFEPMTENSNLFNRALERIIKGHLSENYKPESALSFEEEFKAYHSDIKDFLYQILRVIDKIKVENLDFAPIYEKALKDPHERVRIFYELLQPLLNGYNTYCTNKSYLDFNDLMIKAIDLFAKHPKIKKVFQQQYQYVLVDEFQDVNNLQVSFLKQLITSKTQLFCVGDDWQSIYGFRGSEVDYIINFTKYFRNAKTIKLNLNYRSTPAIVDASNEVIKRNKYKIDKDIQAFKKGAQKIIIYRSQKHYEDGPQFVLQKVLELLNKGFNNEEILILYRRTKMFTPFYNVLKDAGVRVQSKTIHAAKGLEAKIVIIIGLTEGYGGFPDIWQDDRIFQVIKKVDYDLLYEEERRLFYVALTRAKEELILITEIGNESAFVEEIPAQYLTMQVSGLNLKNEQLICPACKNEIQQGYKFCPFCGKVV